MSEPCHVLKIVSSPTTNIHAPVGIIRGGSLTIGTSGDEARVYFVQCNGGTFDEPGGLIIEVIDSISEGNEFAFFPARCEARSAVSYKSSEKGRNDVPEEWDVDFEYFPLLRWVCPLHGNEEYVSIDCGNEVICFCIGPTNLRCRA